jgi:hypothetical protein
MRRNWAGLFLWFWFYRSAINGGVDPLSLTRVLVASNFRRRNNTQAAFAEAMQPTGQKQEGEDQCAPIGRSPQASTPFLVRSVPKLWASTLSGYQPRFGAGSGPEGS